MLSSLYCVLLCLVSTHLLWGRVDAFVVPHKHKTRLYIRIQLVPDARNGFTLVPCRRFITSHVVFRKWNCVESSYTGASPSYHRQPFQRRVVTLWMGKGDGKSKKRKKKTTPTSTSGDTDSSRAPAHNPEPLRVTNNINVPVRHQIRMAQLNKQASRQSSPGFRQTRVQRTAYRRSWDEEEIVQKAEERRRKGQDPNWDVILNRTSTAPLVIVDGYNVIYKWSRLKKHMVKGDPQKARQLLTDDLENLRSLKGWRIECVFDGTRRSTVGPLGHGPGNSNTPTGMDKITRASVSKHGVRVVFTGVGIEADSYIESRCARAKNLTHGELTGSFIVATDDAMIRLAGQNAGALCMSTDRFVSELKAVKKAVEYRVEAAIAKANGHAIRPKSLRGNNLHRFGRRSVLIEDKRNRTKVVKPEAVYELDIDIEVEEDENGIPWWAKAPNQTNPYR